MSVSIKLSVSLQTVSRKILITETVKVPLFQVTDKLRVQKISVLYESVTSTINKMRAKH